MNNRNSIAYLSMCNTELRGNFYNMYVLIFLLVAVLGNDESVRSNNNRHPIKSAN